MYNAKEFGNIVRYVKMQRWSDGVGAAWLGLSCHGLTILLWKVLTAGGPAHAETGRCTRPPDRGVGSVEKRIADTSPLTRSENGSTETLAISVGHVHLRLRPPHVRSPYHGATKPARASTRPRPSAVRVCPARALAKEGVDGAGRRGARGKSVRP